MKIKVQMKMTTHIHTNNIYTDILQNHIYKHKTNGHKKWNYPNVLLNLQNESDFA